MSMGVSHSGRSPRRRLHRHLQGPRRSRHEPHQPRRHAQPIPVRSTVDGLTPELPVILDNDVRSGCRRGRLGLGDRTRHGVPRRPDRCGRHCTLRQRRRYIDPSRIISERSSTLAPTCCPTLTQPGSRPTGRQKRAEMFWGDTDFHGSASRISSLPATASEGPLAWTPTSPSLATCRGRGPGREMGLKRRNFDRRCANRQRREHARGDQNRPADWRHNQQHLAL
jgi:hypothetical protein